MKVAQQVILKERIGFFDRRAVRAELKKFAKLTLEGYEVDVKKTPLKPNAAYVFQEHIGHVVARAKDEKLKIERFESDERVIKGANALSRLVGIGYAGLLLIIGTGAVAFGADSFMEVLKNAPTASFQLLGKLGKELIVPALTTVFLWEMGLKQVPELISNGIRALDTEAACNKIAKEEMKLLK
ncbi:MAG: hypothetical protein V1492_03945 [Candidatus Micrarchaeota archaeon]